MAARKWARPQMLLLAAIAAVLLCVAGWGAYHYMFTVPGASHQGALPALTPAERTLAGNIKTHIATIAAKEHNIDHYDELEKVAQYIERTLTRYGYKTVPQQYTVSGKQVRNIEATIEAATPDAETIVVGAHYDSAQGTPGANDNASGTASVLELARLLSDLKGKSGKRIRLVLFVNEEPPYFATADMGSARYARMLKERGERVTAMYSLETMGFYSDTPGSQKYPMPLGVLFPNRADFVSFVGMLGSRDLVHDALRSFRSHTQFPSVGGVSPGFIAGIAWSDHRSFDREGFQALMITDTALFRYPHYHEPTDTPDKIDNERLARVVKGVERVVRDRAK
jgi:Zn-dependent M28 family amino/carboxypeptidase